MYRVNQPFAKNIKLVFPDRTMGYIRVEFQPLPEGEEVDLETVVSRVDGIADESGAPLPLEEQKALALKDEVVSSIIENCYQTEMRRFNV